MLRYVNEMEYEELLGAKNVPSNFNELAIEASNYINCKTFGRVNKNDVPKQVKYVTCLMIDLLNEQKEKLVQIGNLKSQEIEGWKESYSSLEEIKGNYCSKMQMILSMYLWDVIGMDGKPLLYCGVC